MKQKKKTNLYGGEEERKHGKHTYLFRRKICGKLLKYIHIVVY